MTAATARDLSVPQAGGHRHFFLRRLHSVTGIIFGAYLIVHLIINATLIQGNSPTDYYQTHVDKIHSMPFLLLVIWVSIYMPILYHSAYGIWISLGAKWNVGNYPFEKNWAYILQRISALILVAFILFHILSLKGLFGSHLAFDRAHATATVVRHMNTSWLIAFVVYPIGIIASAYHTANGFWTAGVTWGLTVSAGGLRRWGRLCVGLGALLLVCGLIALFATIHYASHVSVALNTTPRQ